MSDSFDSFIMPACTRSILYYFQFPIGTISFVKQKGLDNIYTFLIKVTFLAHLIHHQMCYCCRKLEIWSFSRTLLQICEAEVRSDNQMTGNRVRESVGGRGSPNSDSLAHGLSTFVMWSVWANQMCHKSLISCFRLCACDLRELLWVRLGWPLCLQMYNHLQLGAFRSFHVNWHDEDRLILHIIKSS